MQYGLHAPLATSTPTRASAHGQNSQQEDTYQEIIPGILQSSLYPTLATISSGSVTTYNNENSLCNKVTKGLDQYLQEAEKLWKQEDNYFHATTRSTNTFPVLLVQDKEDTIQSQDILNIKQQLFDSNESMDDILESPIKYQKVLTNILQTNIDLDVNLPQDPQEIDVTGVIQGGNKFWSTGGKPHPPVWVITIGHVTCDILRTP